MSKCSDDAKGPAMILNSGSVSDTNLTNTDKYGRYTLKYTVGMGNSSFLALNDVINSLMERNTENPGMVKIPWTVDEDTNMVTVKVTSRKKPPVMDVDKRVISSSELRDGDFCKINVTPYYYEHAENINIPLPNGDRHDMVCMKLGVALFLNGVMKLSGESVEDLF